MMRHGALARKRHRKVMKRRWIKRVKTRMLVQFGSFVGSQMYDAWRDRCAGRVK